VQAGLSLQVGQQLADVFHAKNPNSLDYGALLCVLYGNVNFCNTILLSLEHHGQHTPHRPYFPGKGKFPQKG